jgi:sugar (pentulose or hexulose) kinase
LVRHGDAHFYRASLEGIAASLSYGIDNMRSLGVDISRVHAGKANLFLSPLFCELISEFANVDLYLFDSDGASAAAKGAAFGGGIGGSSTKPDTPYGEVSVHYRSRLAANASDELRESYYAKIISMLK